MSKRISQETRERQISDLCNGTQYSFVKWCDKYINCRSKFICRCESHGEWVVAVDNFMKGSRCPTCAGVKRWTSDERELQISELCNNTQYSFKNWVATYSGKDSNFICHCESHGDYITSVHSFINLGHRCQMCSGYKSSIRRRTSKENRESKIKNLMTGTPYSFIGWNGEYKNRNSVFNYSCSFHGRCSVSVTKFINDGVRCPSCANKGYNISLSGVLYALRSEDGLVVKVGISNVVNKRLTQLRRSTPFNFETIELLHFEDGSLPPEFEKMFHDKFDNAGLSGFDGCTEWLKWTPDIQYWFRLLS